MNKKEFYEAPEWGTRVLMVERHILEPSDPGSAADGYEDNPLPGLGD